MPSVLSSPAPRRAGVTTLGLLRREPRLLRAVVALGLFSVAEHAAWVTFLVVAYQRGGVREAGIVSAAMLVPAAVAAPLVAKEMGTLRLRHPLAAGYALQAVVLAIAVVITAADAEPVVFYMAAVLVTVTTVFSRPVHHGTIGAAPADAKLAATVATGAVSGGAQLVGPLLAAVVLWRWDVIEVLAVAALLVLGAAAVTADVELAAPAEESSDPGAAWPPRRPAVREALRVHAGNGGPGATGLFMVLGLTTVVLGVVETLATDIGNDLIGAGGAGTGALIAAAGSGLLVGASLAGSSLRRLSERATMRLGTAVTGVALVLCARDDGLVWSAAAFVLVGAGMQMVLVAGWVLLNRRLQPAATCLVFGLLESQQLLGNALGAAVAGVSIARFGPWAVVGGAVAVLCASTLMMTAPRDRRPVAAPSEAGA